MKSWIFRVYLFLVIIESVSIVPEIKARLNGVGDLGSVFALINISLLILLVGISLFCFWILIRTFLSDNVYTWLDQLSSNHNLFWGILIFFALVFIEGFQDLLFLNANLRETYYPVILRENGSLILWAAIISIQSIAGMLLLGWKKVIKPPVFNSRMVWIVLGILVGFLFLFSSREGSLKTNSPVPSLHILLVVLIVLAGGVALFILLGKKSGLTAIISNDLWAFVILGTLAFTLWVNVPLEPNGFIDIQRPPNFQFSPTSDAIFYETQAQRFLVGEGFGENAQHPFYGYFLSGLHALGGNHYLDIYRIQILLLCLIPFFVYRLASQIGSKFSGWVMGGLIIVREYSALVLGDTITVSNVSVLMTEPLATLGVVLFICLTILWLKARKKNSGFLILIGAVLGLVVLLRVELISLWFVFGLISLVNCWKEWKRWVLSAVLVLAAMSVIIVPWMIRNYQVTGEITIDKAVVLQRTIQSLTPDSNNHEQQSKPIIDLLDYASNKSRSMWYRFSTNVGQSLLYLPSNHLPFLGMEEFIKVVPEKSRVFFFQEGLFSDQYLTNYVKSLPYWHLGWKGSITQRSYLPLLITLALINLGLWVAWKKQKWIGVFPLMVFVIHLLTYAFFNKSGGRYIQVVDWVTAFYLILGINWLLLRFIEGREKAHPIYSYLVQFLESEPEGDPGLSQQPKWRGAAWAVPLFLLGISMPIAERLVPEHYSEKAMAAQLMNLKQSFGKSSSPEILQSIDYIDSSGLSILYGKALYPGYFTAGEKLTDDRQGNLPDEDQSRLVFNLVGTENIWVSVPLSDSPDSFPHGTEVIILGEITRDSEEDRQKRLKPYFLGQKVYLLDKLLEGSSQYYIECDLPSCAP